MEDGVLRVKPKTDEEIAQQAAAIMATAAGAAAGEAK
jgi:hypothetical protein